MRLRCGAVAAAPREDGCLRRLLSSHEPPEHSRNGGEAFGACRGGSGEFSDFRSMFSNAGVANGMSVRAEPEPPGGAKKSSKIRDVPYLQIRNQIK